MSFTSVCAAARKFQDSAKAPFGFVFKDLSTGEQVHYRGDEPFPTASSFKVYILAAIYRRAALGELSLSDRIPLKKADMALGSGVLQTLDEGLELTVKDYATLMMIISDNTATDVCYSLTGKENIQENVLKPLGLKNTRCDFNCKDMIDAYYEMNGRSVEEVLAACGGNPNYCQSAYYACTAEENDQTSPLDALKIYETLYNGEWVSKEVSSEMLSILKQCQTNSRIPFYLPPYTEVAHKTGTLDRLAVDTGIVYTPKGNYYIGMYYNGNMASQEVYDADPSGIAADRYLAECSKAIYDAFME